MPKVEEDGERERKKNYQDIKMKFEFYEFILELSFSIF